MFGKYVRRMVRDWFLAGMLGAVVLATLLPDLGASGGALHADMLGNAGIFLIFLFHGAGISPESMRHGMSRWKLHTMVQLTTFVVFPLLWFGFRFAFDELVPADLMLGFLYLCALPSTISSSVAMTAIAHGNVPGAIFNATLSSLLGIFLTPVIIALAVGSQGGALSLTDAMINIAGLLFLPFVLGQLARPWLGGFIARHKKKVNAFDKAAILILVYNSFCDSVRGGLWRDHGMDLLALTIGGAALFLLVVLVLNTVVARALGFDKADEIAAVFCGSKKTLASGVPMARLLFGAHPALGVIVLPIMFYHQLQLFVCSILAERYARTMRELERDGRDALPGHAGAVAESGAPDAPDAPDAMEAASRS